MRIISLAFAAAVFFGLASSANAGEYVSNKKAHKVLAEGEVLWAGRLVAGGKGGDPAPQAGRVWVKEAPDRHERGRCHQPAQDQP